jgi:hypothetical protein
MNKYTLSYKPQLSCQGVIPLFFARYGYGDNAALAEAENATQVDSC